MIRLISITILTIISLTAFSQSDKVITLQGDTLMGKASILPFNYLIQEVTLKKEKEKLRFKVYEIKSVIIDEEIYHTLNIKDKYQLGLLQKEGYLSWYKYMDSEETTVREFSVSILIKKDGSQLLVPNLGFKKHTLKFLEDCDLVRKKFLNNEYKRTDLDQIVDDYNKCIDENTIKLNAQKNPKNLNTDKAKKIESLIASIKEEGSLADLENVVEMLNDLSNKYKGGSTIPSYLESALRSSLESNASFTEQLNQILE